MIYSVWNGAGFDYYDGPDKTKDPSVPSHLGGKSGQLGVVSEEAAWPLPNGAMKVGSGPMARGMIAQHGTGLALGDFMEDVPWKWVALGVGLYFLMRR